MTDDELIRKARDAWDRLAWVDAKTAGIAAIPALFRAVDERDELRKKREQQRRACAEIIGADVDAWPDHGNVELSVTAALALRNLELEQLRERVAELEEENAAIRRYK